MRWKLPALPFPNHSMTPEQNQAIEEVRRILKLHCDSWIFSYRITGENFMSEINHDWHGNLAGIIGLNSIASSRLMQIALTPPPPPSEPAHPL